MIRTRITLDLELDTGEEARELVELLRLGYVSELGHHSFEVASAVHIHEPDEEKK